MISKTRFPHSKPPHRKFPVQQLATPTTSLEQRSRRPWDSWLRDVFVADLIQLQTVYPPPRKRRLFAPEKWCLEDVGLYYSPIFKGDMEWCHPFWKPINQRIKVSACFFLPWLIWSKKHSKDQARRLQITDLSISIWLSFSYKSRQKITLQQTKCSVCFPDGDWTQLKNMTS